MALNGTYSHMNILNWMVAQSCTTQNWTHADVIITVHSRSTGELARAFSWPWKALELWQGAEEYRQYDSYWCASCGLQWGCMAEHVEGEFFWKFIFADLTNYGGSRPSCKVYKLKEMNDRVSLILTSMLPLCCIAESPIGSIDICGCFHICHIVFHRRYVIGTSRWWEVNMPNGMFGNSVAFGMAFPCFALDSLTPILSHVRFSASYSLFCLLI